MKQIREIITTLLIALIIFVIIQLTIGSFKVYGMSMLPSVYEGDYIIVNKASYVFIDPERVEIVVFRSSGFVVSHRKGCSLESPGAIPVAVAIGRFTYSRRPPIRWAPAFSITLRLPGP